MVVVLDWEAMSSGGAEREGKKARKEKKRKAPEPEAIETVQQEVPKKRRKKNKSR